MDRTYHRSERGQPAHDPHRFRIQARVHTSNHVNIGDTPIRIDQETHDHLPLNITLLCHYRVLHFSYNPVLYPPDSQLRNIQMIKTFTGTRLVIVGLVGDSHFFHQITEIQRVLFGIHTFPYFRLFQDIQMSE